jgi:hypothetical protein
VVPKTRYRPTNVSKFSIARRILPMISPKIPRIFVKILKIPREDCDETGTGDFRNEEVIHDGKIDKGSPDNNFERNRKGNPNNASI